ncbi:Aste57867_24679 [Aphanomyces stellatus]|uniref:Aste57867_24679 protein n=1 Tax=Aphanomyces stellatus TaxID=120398 RepID=A0A485LR46_9STRA|nr:hypothetical protein As57867_024601 [Aphanomyces stellatus]VFU01316.1 Aste57867_24679 [Aphanomyces stellatus]
MAPEIQVQRKIMWFINNGDTILLHADQAIAAYVATRATSRGVYEWRDLTVQGARSVNDPAGLTSMLVQIRHFVRATVNESTRALLQPQALAAYTDLQRETRVALIQFVVRNASSVVDLGRIDLFSSESSFDFMAWLYVVAWVQGTREVVTFDGDYGTITTISDASDARSLTANSLELPVNVACYLRCALLYVTSTLGVVAIVVCVGILVFARGHFEGLNVFVFNRVAVKCGSAAPSSSAQSCHLAPLHSVVATGAVWRRVLLCLGPPDIRHDLFGLG